MTEKLEILPVVVQPGLRLQTPMFEAEFLKQGSGASRWVWSRVGAPGNTRKRPAKQEREAAGEHLHLSTQEAAQWGSLGQIN